MFVENIPGASYEIYEIDPDGGPVYTLWDTTTDIDEAIDVAREIKGYIAVAGDILADYREL